MDTEPTLLVETLLHVPVRPEYFRFEECVYDMPLVNDDPLLWLPEGEFVQNYVSKGMSTHVLTWITEERRKKKHTIQTIPVVDVRYLHLEDEPFRYIHFELVENRQQSTVAYDHRELSEVKYPDRVLQHVLEQAFRQFFRPRDIKNPGWVAGV